MQRFHTPVLCAGGALIASLLSFGPAPAQQQDPNKALAALQAQITELES